MDADIRTLEFQLRDPTDKERQRAAVMRLGMIKSQEAQNLLIATLSNGHADLIVRKRAAKMLGKNRTTAAVPALIKALDAPGTIPTEAVIALGQLGDPTAVAPIRRAMNDQNRSTEFKALCRQSLKTIEFVVKPEPAI